MKEVRNSFPITISGKKLTRFFRNTLSRKEITDLRSKPLLADSKISAAGTPVSFTDLLASYATFGEKAPSEETDFARALDKKGKTGREYGSGERQLEGRRDDAEHKGRIGISVPQNEQTRLLGLLNRLPKEYDIVLINSLVREPLKASGEILDMGAESLVTETEDNPDILYAVQIDGELSPKQAKDIYWGHKILSTLFPHNFPRIYAAYGDANKSGRQLGRYYPSRLTGTIREKIYPHADNTQEGRYSFQAVLSFCKDIGIPDVSVFDFFGDNNFIHGKDGGIYYVDTINRSAYKIFQKLPSNGIREWMDTHTVQDKKTGEEREYTQHEKATVLRALERLRTDNYPKND